MIASQIFIVDDDEDMIRLLSVYVKAGGYRVVTANSGEEALAKLESLSPDLIIADILMPGMKGYEFCRRVREMKREAIPFIFCSALGDHPERIRGLRVGADDYIVKPINSTELLLKIEKLIEKNRQLRDMARRAEESANIGVMSGSLDNLWIGDLLQVFNFLDMPHACLIVTVPEGKTGKIYLENKRLNHAQIGNISGMKALCRILSWKQGKYKVEIDKFKMAPTLNGPLENILMEAAKQVDEFARLRDSILPGPHAKKIVTNSDFLMQRAGENAWLLFKIIGKNEDPETILDISPFTDHETIQIIGELLDAGAIKITDKDKAENPV